MSSPLLSIPQARGAGPRREMEMVSAPAIDIFPSPSDQLQHQIAATQIYKKNLQGMKMIAFVTDITSICNWFLGVCALTWASAVLLGSYIEQLTKWDYYDVSLLLFFEGIRFGIAALVRLIGYRLWKLVRWSLRSVAFVLPLGMGGFAVLSILPLDIRVSIHRLFSGDSHNRYHMLHVITTISHAPPPSDSSYSSLTPSLRIFYILVLSNAFLLLLGTSIAGLMRRSYVRSTVKSLSLYYDRKMDNTTSSWLEPADDVAFAFQMQGLELKQGNDARYVCQNYADLIWYLYMHGDGVEVAAETALAAEDRFVREAAANTVGFWAVLEALIYFEAFHPHDQPQGLKVPLCFQRGMLSKLADIAAESYGSLGTAAARAFAPLLGLVDLKWIGMVACVHSKSTGQDLIDILLSRTAELLRPPCPSGEDLPLSLKEESHAHVNALRQYLLRLQSTCEGSDMKAFIEAQQAQLVEKVEKALPEMVKNSNVSTIQSLNNQLSDLLKTVGPADIKSQLSCKTNYYFDIKKSLMEPSPLPSWRADYFSLLFHVLFPLVCLGGGFIVNALV